MANNFSDATVAISNNSLTDIVTASNKSMVIAGTLSNTGTAAINVTVKKYDASATTAFSIITLAPLPAGSSLQLPKLYSRLQIKFKLNQTTLVAILQ